MTAIDNETLVEAFMKSNKTLDEALVLAALTASVSHNHPEGVKGAQAIATSVFLCKQGRQKQEIKKYVEEQLEREAWDVDVVLSHTTPLKYEPVEVFMSGVDQSKVDKSTENWLDKIEDRLSYKKWYCGHYHTEKKIDNLEIMFENFDEFGLG